MTDQITVPKQTWDAMRDKIEKALIYLAHSGKFSRSSAKGVLNEALTAANAVQPQALVHVDWQDMYWKEKRRAEMWVAKYEKDIGPLEVAHPQATEPAPEASKLKLQVSLVDRPVDVELAQYQRMFSAACADLGLINESLGLDPNDGGAEPILFAIQQLRDRITPDGMKLVPIEPTPEMTFAGDAVWVDCAKTSDCIGTKSIYRAMLAAAPETKQ